jgi:mannose-6-phosphate isomerase-like protein (cupin superfamily)
MTATAFAPDDPRSALPGPTSSADTATAAPREPQVHDLGHRAPQTTSGAGSRSWYVRGQNFCVGLTDLVADDELAEADVHDEHLVLVPDAGVCVTVDGPDGPDGPVSVTGPGLLVVAPGASVVTADRRCTVVRIFSSYAADVMHRAGNRDAYAQPDPAVALLPPVPPGGSGRRPTRALRLEDVPDTPGRFGRIVRSSSLMVNWFPVQVGPRSEDHLSPHVHDDFEQASLTLGGDFVHHFRSPWTPRLSEWRADEHHSCGSPSVAIIPPGVVHTTRAVGAGDHHLIDVFAPPRADFTAQGWVLNQDDYADDTRDAQATP